MISIKKSSMHWTQPMFATKNGSRLLPTLRRPPDIEATDASLIRQQWPFRIMLVSRRRLQYLLPELRGQPEILKDNARPAARGCHYSTVLPSRRIDVGQLVTGGPLSHPPGSDASPERTRRHAGCLYSWRAHRSLDALNHKVAKTGRRGGGYVELLKFRRRHTMKQRRIDRHRRVPVL